MRNKIRNCISSISVGLFLAFAAACSSGGGTIGTGGKSVDGLLRSTNGTPLANVQVTLLETGDQSVTDAAGQFQLDTSVQFDSASFEFQGSGVNSVAQVSGIPEGDRVEIEFEVDDSNGSVKPVKVRKHEANESEDVNDDQGGSGSQGGENEGSGHSSSSSASSSEDNEDHGSNNSGSSGSSSSSSSSSGSNGSGNSSGSGSSDDDGGSSGGGGNSGGGGSGGNSGNSGSGNSGHGGGNDD